MQTVYIIDNVQSPYFGLCQPHNNIKGRIDCTLYQSKLFTFTSDIDGLPLI